MRNLDYYEELDDFDGEEEDEAQGTLPLIKLSTTLVVRTE